MNFNPRMKFVWLAQSLAAVLVLLVWVLLLVAFLPLNNTTFDGISDRVLMVFIVLLLSLLIIVAAYVGAELFYRNFEYDFSGDSFVVRKGIFTRKEFIIPYKDIESAKVLRSGVHALDQVFGLTCIQVRYKGGKTILIPGINEPEVFLRRLMANVQGNEMIKNSEIYLSEKEILMKLAADVKNMGEKLDQYISEQKLYMSSQRPSGQNYPFEFLKTSKDVDTEKLIDIKTFGGLKKPEPGELSRKKKKDE